MYVRMISDRHVNEEIDILSGHLCVYSWMCALEWWLTLAEQLLALCVTLQAMKSYFMTTYQGRWGVGDGGVLWSPVFYSKSVSSSCLLSGWRQKWVVQNMHEFFHNLSCPLAGRRGRAYLLRVLSAAHKTPGTQFVTARMASTREVDFKWM